MAVTMVALIALALLLLLLLIRVPVALGLLVSGSVGILLIGDFRLLQSVLGRDLFSSSSRFVLIIVPLFLLMSVLAKRGTVARDAFAAASRLTRRVPGGLAVATVLGCAGFSAISGSSVATAATMGPIAIPEMERAGYRRSIAAGAVGAAGTLGVLIPPSIALVLYGIITQESIGALLLAGVVPGILTAVGYSIALVGRATITSSGMGQVPAPISGNRVTDTQEDEAHPASDSPSINDLSDGPVADDRVKISSLLRIGSLFLVVVGGIYSGLFSATEAAAVGALVTLVFYLADIRKRVDRLSEFLSSIRESASLSSSILILLVGASVFTFFIVYGGLPARFTNAVLAWEIGPLALLIFLLLAFIPLGMILDPLSMMLIAVPIAYPVITTLGFDGIWFGILVIKVVELGLITPPVGLNAFVVAGSVREVTIEEAFRGIMWFFPVDIVIIVLLVSFPQLVLWLPDTMM